jgi:hypothetical protein
MSVIENLDIVLGAKTQQFDSALRTSVSDIGRFRGEVQNMSISMAALSPIASESFTGAGAFASSLPGVAIASKVFLDVSQSLKDTFDARQAREAQRLADAVDRVAKKAKEAAQEVKQLQAEVSNPQGRNVAEALAGGKFDRMPRGLRDRDGSESAEALVNAAMFGSKRDMQSAYLGVNSARSKKDQADYEAGIDSAIAKSATYKSSWTAAGQAASSSLGISSIGVAGVAAGAAVLVGGIVAVGMAWHNVSEEMKRIDEISDSANKLGMTFRDLSNMRLSIGESSGLDAGTIDSAMQRMQVGLAEASSKQSGDLFDKLAASGLNAAQLLKQGPAKAMEEIAAKTQALQSPTDQLLLAYELFGKQGAAIVSSLRDGPGAMQEMAAYADRVGMNLSQAQAEQVGAANDAWDRMGMVATGAWRQIAAEASPVLTVIYESIAEGTSQFSVYLQYLPAIIDGGAMFAGTLADVYELASLVQTTLHNITTLNWTEVGKDIESAFTFDRGAKNVAAIQKARDEAAEQARNKDKFRTESESVFAEAERKKELAKEQAEIEKKAAADLQRAQEDRYKAARQAEANVAKKFEDLREELEIQKILASMSAEQAAKEEDAIRTRMSLHKDLAKEGMSDFSKIDAIANQTAALKQSNADRQKATEISKEFAMPQNRLIEKMRELESMRQRGLINEETFRKASLKAESETRDEKGLRGAVSAQAGSVEAYKLLLDRENNAAAKAEAQRRIAESQLTVQKEIASALSKGPVLRSARG